MTDQSKPHPMTDFDSKWDSPESYIIGITREIWEERGVDKLNALYATEIPVRFPGGVSIGNQAVITSTHATLAEFPDRQLLGEDVIWSDDGEGGFLSSHRLLSTATHTGDGAFGAATGTKLVYRTLADCATRANTIYDEWLVRDVGAMVRQLGHTPQEFATAQIESEGGVDSATRPLTPESAPAAVYTGFGNDHSVGLRYQEMLSAVAAGDYSEIESDWDRAVQIELPGGVTGHGWPAVQSFWSELRAAIGDAVLHVEHRVGRDDPALGARAALRWWLSGTHTGDGIFGPASGAALHIMGISHAEFGPWGLRREWVVFDEVAVWKQILLAR